MRASLFWHAVPNGAIVVHPIADFSEHLVDALTLDNGYLMRQNLKFKCVNVLVAIRMDPQGKGYARPARIFTLDVLPSPHGVFSW